MSRRVLLLCAGLVAWAAGLGSEPCESGPRRVAPYPVWASPAEARVTVLRPPAAAAWWSGAWAAWDLAGAASAAAALTDLTGHSRPLIAYGGGWSAGAGWGVGGGNVLSTQYVADSTDVLVLVRVTDCPLGSGLALMGANAANPSRWTTLVIGNSGQAGYGHGTASSASVTSTTSGVWGVGPGYGIRQGAVATTWTQTGDAAPYSIYIGASHSPGGAAWPIAAGCRVRSAAIWTPALSSTEAVARAAAMP